MRVQHARAPVLCESTRSRRHASGASDRGVQEALRDRGGDPRARRRREAHRATSSEQARLRRARRVVHGSSTPRASIVADGRGDPLPDESRARAPSLHGGRGDPDRQRDRRAPPRPRRAHEEKLPLRRVRRWRRARCDRLHDPRLLPARWREPRRVPPRHAAPPRSQGPARGRAGSHARSVAGTPRRRRSVGRELRRSAPRMPWNSAMNGPQRGDLITSRALRQDAVRRTDTFKRGPRRARRQAVTRVTIPEPRVRGVSERRTARPGRSGRSSSGPSRGRRVAQPGCDLPPLASSSFSVPRTARSARTARRVVVGARGSA